MNDLDVKVWFDKGETTFSQVRHAYVTDRGELIISDIDMGTRAAFAPGAWVKVECKQHERRKVVE